MGSSPTPGTRKILIITSGICHSTNTHGLMTNSKDQQPSPAADTSPWRDMRSVLRQSISMLGFWMTLRYLLIYALSYKPVADRSFDRKHATNTGGLISTCVLENEIREKYNMVIRICRHRTGYGSLPLNIQFRVVTSNYREFSCQFKVPNTGGRVLGHRPKLCRIRHGVGGITSETASDGSRAIGTAVCDANRHVHQRCAAKKNSETAEKVCIAM